MIYLSRLPLDPMSRRVQKELSAPYEMHRTLCHAFPDLSDDEWKATRVLFRADDDEGRLSLLVQSQRAPDWNALVARLEGKRYLLSTPQMTSWKSVEEQLQDGEFRLKVGQQLRFRLQANPTYSAIIAGALNKKGRFQSKVVGLYREAERLDWLRRQSEGHGFELPLVETTLLASRDENGKRMPIPFRGGVDQDEWTLELPVCEMVDLNDGKRFALPSQKNQFSAALFDGQLRVTDSKAFANAVENGIGKARGFGFGLLSVAPVAK